MARRGARNVKDTPTAAERCYCARLKYPNKEQFYIGTVRATVRAPDREIEAEIWKLWDRMMPRIVKPMIVALVPGEVIFVPAGDNEEGIGDHG